MHPPMGRRYQFLKSSEYFFFINMPQKNIQTTKLSKKEEEDAGVEGRAAARLPTSFPALFLSFFARQVVGLKM